MAQKFTTKTLKKFLSGKYQKNKKKSPIKYKKDKVYMCFDKFEIQTKENTIYINYFYRNELLYQQQDFFCSGSTYIVCGLKLKMGLDLLNL